MEAIWIALAGGLAWLFGETGRTLITGGVGGMTRWFWEDQRTIRSFTLAWGGGALCGVYLTPIMMWVVGYAADPTSTDAENVRSAFVFVTGAVGISLLKIIVAGLEARGKKWSKGDE